MTQFRDLVRTQKKKIKAFFAKRQHPIRIVKYMAKYVWLLVFSLGKYLIATQFDIQSWLEANWFDLLVLIFIGLFAVVRWAFVYYELGEDSITAHTGFLGMSSTTVYFAQIASLSLCQGAVYRFFGACTVYIDTDAKSIQSTDIRIDLTKKKAMEIYHRIADKAKREPRFTFISDKKNLVIFSLLFSSALSGAIIFCTIIYEVYQIVGTQFNKTIIDKVNSQLVEIRDVPESITKYFFLAVGIIGIIWIMSFAANLMRHWNFICTRCKNYLLVHSGKGARRHHVIMRKYVNFIDFRQSFLMKIFKICSVGVQCTGYGKRRLEISALIPITTTDQAQSSAKMLVPKITPCEKQVYTGKADIGRFVMLPALCVLIPFAVGIVLTLIFPEWSSAIHALEVLAAVPLIWLAIVKSAAALSTSIGFDEENCTLSYCKWYTFHKVVCSRENISKVEIYQNWFSMVSKTCGVVIYTTGEKTQKHAVKGLYLKEAKALLEENGYSFVTEGEEENAEI